MFGTPIMVIAKKTGQFTLAVLFGGILFLTILSSTAEAIPPPEIVRIGPIIAQVLALLIILFTTAIFFLRTKIRVISDAIRRRRLKLLLLAIPILVAITALLGISAYVRKKNTDLMVLAPVAAKSATVGDGIMTVAGMQIDISDPSLAIQAQEAAKFLGNKQYLFIDIREPIEFSTRHIAGFTNMRVGDLVAGEEYKKLDIKKTIVLICEVGERGSAIAVFLRVRGYQALFIDKGIRGWQEKKLKFVGSDKMYLPDFRNKYKTVTVDEAKKLVTEGKAILVDVRSPGEFINGHLAGAVNIPLVNMPTGELEKALHGLPKDKKIIGVGYDRFGVYYCMILGYMLNQISIDYGGTLKYQPRNQTL